LARKGANSDITELKGLTTALSIAQGGTGATKAEDARTNLGLGSSATRNAYSSSGDILSLGDFGLGSARGDTASIPDSTNGNSADLKTGFYASNGDFVGTPGGIGNGQYVGVIVYNCTNNNLYKFQIAGSYSASGRMFFRSMNNGGYNAWRELYHTANTTKASDGTLKAASPVVKLFSDGSFETNDESEGCTVTRLAIGEYLVEGCEGLNSDAAWGGIDGGFDIPTDRNKQPLIWLDYEVNADGSVLVKTYHRKHPDAPAFARNELQGINDGDPVDIPGDQFVSVRVEMPQNSIWHQRTATAEIPDSPAG
ncbi:pyocin knob domain-containing protein, partial [Enterobacter ludwigii]|uniref:pyocin knob domain-containing protein n=1 Tax=Enterobacter ludwigii TaxID=299767 RepID=UPI003CD0CCEB